MDAVVYNDNRPVLDMLLYRVGDDDINDRDDSGDPVVFKAVQWSASKCLPAFLDAGADHLAINKNRGTILHKIAATGSSEIMDVLKIWINSRPFMKTVDLALRNMAGKQPWTCFMTVQP